MSCAVFSARSTIKALKDDTMCLLRSHKNKTQFLFSSKIFFLIKGKEINLTLEVLCERRHFETRVGSWVHWSHCGLVSSLET